MNFKYIFSEFNWTYAVRIGREKGVSQSPTHLPTTENLDIVEYLKKESVTESKARGKFDIGLIIGCNSKM